MSISRRDFLRYSALSGAALGLPASVLVKLEEAYAAGGEGLPTVVWLNGANCTGCTVSLANLVGSQGPTDLADLLINYISLDFHPNLMAAAGDLAVQHLKEATAGDFVLVVDGGVPTAFNGHTCLLWCEGGRDVTALEAVQDLAPRALATLCVGTCASFGGIPAGNPNPTGILSVADATGGSTINIPGCPAHPDWIVWTVAQLLVGTVPTLDDRGRPAALFQGDDNIIHKRCPRKGTGEVKDFGIDGHCLKELGCKGPSTHGDCMRRLWNNGTNWCIGANALCIGCTDPGFPDKLSPFFRIPAAQTNPEPTAGEVVITKAEWRSDTSELRVDGKAGAGELITVKNADTGAVLGAVSAAGDGTWRFRQQNPQPIPQKVRAEGADSDDEREVTGVPGTGTGTTEAFAVTKAEWKADKSRLRVEGKGSTGDKVVVRSAATGLSLGAVPVDASGAWRLDVNNPSPVPTTIRAECDGQSIERAVDGAPDSAAAPAEFQITKAEWRADRRELRVDGKGPAGTVVSVRNADTGAKLGSALVDPYGKWRLKVKKPSPVPSRVQAICDGAFEEREVTKR
ncbi:MAG: hypothetical protein Kow0092_28660 [Deferrisomatales bacterium]